MSIPYGFFCVQHPRCATRAENARHAHPSGGLGNGEFVPQPNYSIAFPVAWRGIAGCVTRTWRGRGVFGSFGWTFSGGTRGFKADFQRKPIWFVKHKSYVSFQKTIWLMVKNTHTVQGSEFQWPQCDDTAMVRIWIVIPKWPVLVIFRLVNYCNSATHNVVVM